jgi:ribosomal protein S10
MPLGASSLPVRRTHFTVISGPHVHKYAREQYARTTHTRLIRASTNNISELHWLLDSIKQYK